MDTKKQIQLDNLEEIISKLRKELTFTAQWHGFIETDNRIQRAHILVNELQSKIYRYFME